MGRRIDFRENLPYEITLEFMKEAAKETGLAFKVISFKDQIKDNQEALRFYKPLFDSGWISTDVFMKKGLSKAKISITRSSTKTGVPSAMLYGNWLFTKKQAGDYEKALIKQSEEYLGPTFRKNPILE